MLPCTHRPDAAGGNARERSVQRHRDATFCHTGATYITGMQPHMLQVFGRRPVTDFDRISRFHVSKQQVCMPAPNNKHTMLKRNPYCRAYVAACRVPLLRGLLLWPKPQYTVLKTASPRVPVSGAAVG